MGGRIDADLREVNPGEATATYTTMRYFLGGVWTGLGGSWSLCAMLLTMGGGARHCRATAYNDGGTHSGVQRKTGIKDRRNRYRSVASAERIHAAPRPASKEVCVKEESIHSSDQEDATPHVLRPLYNAQAGPSGECLIWSVFDPLRGRA